MKNVRCDLGGSSSTIQSLATTHMSYTAVLHSCGTSAHKEPLPIEIQLGSNAVTLTREGWKLGEWCGAQR